VPGAPLLRRTCSSRSPHVVTLDNRFHRRPTGRRTFETGFRRSDFGLLGGVALGFTRRSGSQVQHYLIVLPLHRSEIASLLASSTVRAFGHSLRFGLSVSPPFSSECLTSLTGRHDLLCRLLTSDGLTSGGLRCVSATGLRSPQGGLTATAFAARPPDLPPRSLMVVDFAIIRSLVRPGRPRYPVFVHRAAALLHAFFRPHLAVTCGFRRSRPGIMG